MGWVRGYELAWRAGDPSAVESLFTEDARYLRSPYEEPLQGHQAIKDFWLADEGETFTMTAEPVAVEGDAAVVRVEVRYGEPVRQEYRDLWLLQVRRRQPGAGVRGVGVLARQAVHRVD